MVGATLRRWGTALLRSETLSRAADRHWARSLRVLTYHTVPDAIAFAAQMEFLARRYRPVDAAAVIAALGGSGLPPRAVWVTFDDGDPSVVRRGLPALSANGVPATLFVCPGVIESGEPLWPARVEAVDLPLLRELLPVLVETSADAIAYLKAVDDATRRAFVSGLPWSGSPEPVQLESGDLHRWLDAGMDVGNHSWDHPCLDRCTPEEQVRQVERSDRWLRETIPGWVPTFAYPNGNSSAVVADALAARDYAMAVLHDHRLARSLDDRYHVSRLQIEATDDVDRLRSVTSGVQPGAAHLTTSLSKLLGRGTSQTVYPGVRRQRRRQGDGHGHAPTDRDLV